MSDQGYAKAAQKWRGRIAGARHGRGYATRAEALAAFRLVPDEPAVDAQVLAGLAEYAVRERATAIPRTARC